LAHASQKEQFRHNISIFNRIKSPVWCLCEPNDSNVKFVMI